MAQIHTIIGHSPSNTEAERAVLELQRQGFDMQKLSITGKDYQITEHLRGFLTCQDTKQLK